MPLLPYYHSCSSFSLEREYPPPTPKLESRKLHFLEESLQIIPSNLSGISLYFNIDLSGPTQEREYFT